MEFLNRIKAQLERKAFNVNSFQVSVGLLLGLGLALWLYLRR